MGDRLNDRRRALSANIILAMMACTAVAAARALMPIEGPADSDFALFLIPWIDVIQERGLASISGEFSAYTPPYIYLLNIAALIEPAVGAIAAVKLLNLPFVALLGWGIGAVVKEATGDREIAKIAVAVTLVTPTVLVNAFAYGQADVIFTAFLVWFVVFAMRGRMKLAAVMFGLSLSFKFQAMFLSPLLLALLLNRRMQLLDALIVPVVYLGMMVPAAVAGRPWSELLTILFRQSAMMQELSLYAPNPWWFLGMVIDYQAGLIIGLIVASGVALWIALASQRLPPTANCILLIATVCAAVMPYVLPKMAARYFIVADVLTIALALTRPSVWPAAVLIQVASLLAVMSYFTGRPAASLAFFPATLAVALILYNFVGAATRPSER